ncbi:hypothetical protein [Pseudomonas sp. Irchel 3A7]|uniref:hypothetical protein n=1 Tax=Pseudomonas sp. Irchel 3A7 TaxID=2008913 RepID=UPI000BA30707|nr:hypothetical protein [Pseudomonas sp. Irchel 3A7]
MARQEQAQAPAPEGHGLGAAIEKIIADEVERRVAEAMQERKPIRQMFNAPKPYTDFEQLPPVAKTRPPKNIGVQVFRDGAGLMRWLTVGDVKFEIQRDGADRIVGMRQVDESPVLPALDIAVKTEARYNPGVPRKLYGNTPEV